MECRLKEKKRAAVRVEQDHSDAGDGADGPPVVAAIEQSSSNYDTSAGAESLLEDSVENGSDPVTISVEIVPSSPSRQSAVKVSSEVEEKAQNAAEVSDQTIQSKDNDPPFLCVDSKSITTEHLRVLSSNVSLGPTPPNEPLDSSLDQSIYLTPSSRLQSPERVPTSGEGVSTAVRRVRSDSFTLDEPSSMLVQHLKTFGISFDRDDSKTEPADNTISESSTLISDSLDQSGDRSFTANTSTKTAKFDSSPAESDSSPAKSKDWMQRLTNKLNSSFGKSPKKCQPSPIARSDTHRSDTHRSPARARSHASRLRSPAGTTMGSPPPPPTTSPPPPADYSRILTLIEEQHAAQVNELLWRQQEERKRMQLEFRLQQDELMRKITDLVGTNAAAGRAAGDATPASSTDRAGSDTDCNASSEPLSDVEFFDTNRNAQRATPDQGRCIRRLDYEEAATSARKSPELDNAMAVELAKRRAAEAKAASVIAAHVRGYLTRRLFSTNKVGNIVKTIRDTLLFLLDMHFQRKDDESPADIELKSQLLQQVILADTWWSKCRQIGAGDILAFFRAF